MVDKWVKHLKPVAMFEWFPPSQQLCGKVDETWYLIASPFLNLLIKHHSLTVLWCSNPVICYTLWILSVACAFYLCLQCCPSCNTNVHNYLCMATWPWQYHFWSRIQWVTEICWSSVWIFFIYFKLSIDVLLGGSMLAVVQQELNKCEQNHVIFSSSQ